VIDDSESLVTPHEAFCRILEVIRPENPGLGKKVTGPHWRYELPRASDDALACGNALGFLDANVSASKIGAQGIKKGTEHDGPKPINTAELRTGILNVWDGTLKCRTGGEGGRLYRNVFLSMADLNRELGVPPVKEAPKQNGKRTAKLATSADFKFDWDGALIEVMAFLQQNPPPTRPGPIVKVMQDWFKDQPSGEPQREPLYQRARRILERMKSVD
jgi:hypothetical protein